MSLHRFCNVGVPTRVPSLREKEIKEANASVASKYCYHGIFVLATSFLRDGYLPMVQVQMFLKSDVLECSFSTGYM